MKRMYSAVPGRVYVATRAHSASGDRELSLSKGDKVKGEEGAVGLKITVDVQLAELSQMQIICLSVGTPQIKANEDS